jgi:hypothetical protein
MSTQPATWQTELDAFRTRTTTGAWKLPRDRVASDLEAAVTSPDGINQGAFGFCGIAAFLRFWARRDPAAFITFATAVYEHGAAAFTTYHVDPGSDLRGRDYMSDYATGKTRCPPGLWMVMGAIQDSISPAGFDGSVDRSWYAFLCLHEGAQPTQIEKLLADTRLYSHVDNRTDWAALVLPRMPFVPNPWRPSLTDAKSLSPGAGCDIVLQVNDIFLKGASPVPAGLAGEIADDFPNHFIALASKLTIAGGNLRGRVWTWAGLQDLDLPPDRFMTNYYGAIVCTV